MRKAYYVGRPQLKCIPLRIGPGFSADSAMEARAKAAGILAEAGEEYGYLCEIRRDSVTLLCSVSADGRWSKFLSYANALPNESDSRWQWKKIKTKVKGNE